MASKIVKKNKRLEMGRKWQGNENVKKTQSKGIRRRKKKARTENELEIRPEKFQQRERIGQ